MARIQQVAFNFTANTQFGPWLRHDYYAEPFNVTLAVYFGSGLNATLGVQLIIDDVDYYRPVSITQSVNTITVNDNGPPSGGAAAAGHGLAVGDYVRLNNTPGGTVDGDYNVTTVTSATVYTLTSTVSQTLTQQTVQVGSGRIFTHGVLTGLTARANSNYTFPVWGSRLIDTAFTAGGYGFLVAMQGGRSS